MRCILLPGLIALWAVFIPLIHETAVHALMMSAGMYW
jgi:hypothetical protein